MKIQCHYQGKIKIYSDGADVQTMLAMAANPLVQGLTTNPTLMRQVGVQDYRAFSKEILEQIKTKPISFEVFADEFDEMGRQAMEIASWGKNVYVKIPVTNSKGESSMKLVEELSHRNVKLNVTAVFTVEQVQETCSALKGGSPAVVSVFAGRIADAGYDPVPILREASQICKATGSDIELLWASSREALNIVQAEASGCDIITVTPDLIKKMTHFKKDLTQFSLETVQMFKRDAEAAGYRL